MVRFINLLILGFLIITSNSQNTIIGKPADTSLTEQITLKIDGVGDFSFDPLKQSILTPDLFKQGHFSILDCLVYLSAVEKKITLEYHYSKEHEAYKIDKINNLEGNWWYYAHYDGGNTKEVSSVRMKYYLVKDKMYIRFAQIDDQEWNHKYDVFKTAVDRKSQHGGKIIIPKIVVNRSKDANWEFKNVEIKPFNIRTDIYQENVVTAIDVILTLGKELKLKDEVLWYDHLWNYTHPDNPVIKAYRVESINSYEHSGACGWVYELGEYCDYLWKGNMIHVQSDERVVFSPDYYLIEWIELGKC